MDKRYWDSDCFLGWLLEEEDKVQSCGEVLSDAEAGKVQIITSALTIAEVLAVRHKPKLNVSTRLKVEGFFKQSYIAVRSVTRRTSERARELVWDHGIMPKDAIHVATAIEAGMTILNTFDAGLLRKSMQCGGDPLLCIEKPYVRAPQFQLQPPERH